MLDASTYHCLKYSISHYINTRAALLVLCIALHSVTDLIVQLLHRTSARDTMSSSIEPESLLAASLWVAKRTWSLLKII